MTNHVDLTTAAEIHEDKRIVGALTTDAGKVITPSSSTAGTSELRKLKTSELEVNGGTPWTGVAAWADSTYTSGSKRAISTGVRTKVTIDGLGAQTDSDQLPSGSEWWSTLNNKIVPDADGDAYDVRLIFKATPAASSDYFDVELDIGGSIGVILEETKIYAKGTSDHSFVVSWAIRTKDTFLANGGEIYITPNSNQSFWDFNIQITKTHLAV